MASVASMASMASMGYMASMATINPGKSVWICSKFNKNKQKITIPLAAHVQCIYTVLHIFRQVLFWAGNQGNHQNFEKNKNQNGRLKKNEIFNSPNSQYFFVKIAGIGPYVSRINWFEGHQCGSTYMVVSLSDVSSKPFFSHFWRIFGTYWFIKYKGSY